MQTENLIQNIDEAEIEAIDAELLECKSELTDLEIEAIDSILATVEECVINHLFSLKEEAATNDSFGDQLICFKKFHGMMEDTYYKNVVGLIITESEAALKELASGFNLQLVQGGKSVSFNMEAA